MEEYFLFANEGGDWYNYTFDWGTAPTAYNVYLRYGAGQNQDFALYNLGNNAQYATPAFTNLLGTFYATNSLWWNFRYAPLVDSNNNPVAVTLGGGSQPVALRLEVAPDMPGWDSIQYQSALNYMAFVPAAPQVYSCAQIQPTNTHWTVEGTTLVDTGRKQIIIRQPSSGTKYYRVGWNSRVKVNKLVVSGGNVVLNYQ